MTNPITPEVRAAVVRLRRLSQGDEYFDIYGVHPSGHGMQQRDEALVTNAMLSLLPPGMPDRVSHGHFTHGVELLTTPTTHENGAENIAP